MTNAASANFLIPLNRIRTSIRVIARTFLTVILLILPVSHLKAGEAKNAKTPPAPVVVVEPANMRSIHTRQTYSGRVEAMKRIELIARVGGFLTKRNFDEGANVNQGDVLFEIEPKSYEISLAEAEAGAASALSALRDAQENYDRTEILQKSNTLSRASLSSAQARLGEAQAAADASNAKLEQAELSLSYTKIRAPISGRIGRVVHAVGDLVGPTTSELATLVSQDPMYVAFAVPQIALSKIQKSIANTSAASTKVELKLADGSMYPHSGQLSFIATQAGRSTDTILVRANIANPDSNLIDEQLVDVVLIDEAPKDLLLVSQTSLLLDQEGSYVLVVSEKNKVEKKSVKIGKQYGANVAIVSGLTPGENVIVSGHHRVHPGITVAAVMNDGKAKAPHAQAAK